MKKFESGAQKRQKKRLFEKAAQSQRGSIEHFLNKSEPCGDSLGAEFASSLSPDPSVAVNLSPQENLVNDDLIAPSDHQKDYSYRLNQTQPKICCHCWRLLDMGT